MRDRLITVLVGLTLTVIVLYAVPRVYMLADRVQTSAACLRTGVGSPDVPLELLP